MTWLRPTWRDRCRCQTRSFSAFETSVPFRFYTRGGNSKIIAIAQDLSEINEHMFYNDIFSIVLRFNIMLYTWFTSKKIFKKRNGLLIIWLSFHKKLKDLTLFCYIIDIQKTHDNYFINHILFTLSIYRRSYSTRQHRLYLSKSMIF